MLKERPLVLSWVDGTPPYLLQGGSAARYVPTGHIVYAVGTAGPKPKLDFWLISVQGGPPTHLGLSLEGLLPYGLSVHPGGQRIAFTAGTPRRSELWVLENFLPAFKTAK